MSILWIDAMKDTALLDEGDGCLQVLGHTKAEHDAGQPPPAGSINGKLRTFTVDLRQGHSY